MPVKKQYLTALGLGLGLFICYLVIFKPSQPMTNYRQREDWRILQNSTNLLDVQTIVIAAEDGPLEDEQIDLEQCGCKRKLDNVRNNPPGLVLNKTTCGQDAFRRGPGQKIVAFIFYGDINSKQV
jgi:hypothetical protein